MKISYRTHPILEKIELGSLGKIPIYEEDREFFDLNVKIYISLWKKYLPYFKRNIMYISGSFMEAAEKASVKLCGLYNDIAKDDIMDFEVCNTYLSGSFCVQIYQSFKKGSEDIETAMFGFEKDGKPLFFYVDNDEYFQTGWCSRAYNMPVGVNPKGAQDWLNAKLAFSVVIEMFKRYAEVETKILPANQTTKGIDCKYCNDTKLNITHFDSRWFTTICKSDGFPVRGFFRWQVCGEGRKDRKIKWIDPFEKSGYTAPARKLNQ